MKRDDIWRAQRLDRELSELETKLKHYQFIDRFTISSGCMLELGNYDDPSQIGRGFRAVRDAIVQMLENQIADLKREMAALGVTEAARPHG